MTGISRGVLQDKLTCAVHGKIAVMGQRGKTLFERKIKRKCLLISYLLAILTLIDNYLIISA
jgi:hypothetical protein